MGYRLHYASTYKVEWKGGDFNHHSEEVNSLLSDICPEFYGNNDISDEYADRIEIPKKSLEIAVDELYRRQAQREEYLPWMVESDYKWSDIADIINEWLAGADPDDDYVHLNWF